MFIRGRSQQKLGSGIQSILTAEKDVRSEIKQKTALPLDEADPTGQGGNANKGDHCKKLMVDHRELLVSLVPVGLRDDFRTLLCRLWVILKVYNSKRKVDVGAFKDFCLNTYIFVFEHFNNDNRWISIPPTVHALLAHSWELVSNNDGRGCGEFPESGLEHNNKFLRFYRQHLARKVSQEMNLEDCLTRLWLRSDPSIRCAGPLPPKCSRCCGEHFTVSCPHKQETRSGAPKLDDYYLELMFMD